MYGLSSFGPTSGPLWYTSGLHCKEGTHMESKWKKHLMNYLHRLTYADFVEAEKTTRYLVRHAPTEEYREHYQQELDVCDIVRMQRNCTGWN